MHMVIYTIISLELLEVNVVERNQTKGILPCWVASKLRLLSRIDHKI